MKRTCDPSAGAVGIEKDCRPPSQTASVTQESNSFEYDNKIRHETLPTLLTFSLLISEDFWAPSCTGSCTLVRKPPQNVEKIARFRAEKEA